MTNAPGETIVLTFEIGDYIPPSCAFNRVTINFTVTSAGRQFDRLALMFFNDTEIFRTSTAEPTQHGIAWTYIKDMSNYLSLFQDPQKIIFDLGNLIDSTYTASWDTTLTATFFTADDEIDPADSIIPVSARKSAQDASSAYVVPASKAINTFKLPQNARKAVFSISACGQAAEEFWWSNVLSSDTNVFGNETTLYGHSPFRELQLFIDGYMAGVAWPFPVIFTGGVVPGFWRPIVGIDAFDLRDDEIDITPFIPLLSDDKGHTFEIRVIGVDDDGHGNWNLTQNIESNWVVTGKVFIWLDSNGNITTGTLPTISAPAPSIKLGSTVNPGTNGTVNSLDYSIDVARNLDITAILQTSQGLQTVSWRQNLTYSNSGTLTNQGNDQNMQQKTAGSHVSASGYSRTYEYPLWMISSYDAPPNGNTTINATMGRGKYVQEIGDLAFPNAWKTFDYSRLPSPPYRPSFLGSQENNWQNGSASYLGVPAQKKSYGTGDTEQLYSLSGLTGDSATIVQDGTNTQQASQELYSRHIRATNDSIVFDEQRFGNQPDDNSNSFTDTNPAVDGSSNSEAPAFAPKNIRAMLGRGPPLR